MSRPDIFPKFSLQILSVVLLCFVVAACTTSSKVGPQGGGGGGGGGGAGASGAGASAMSQAEQALAQANADREASLTFANQMEVAIAGDPDSVSHNDVYAQIFRAYDLQDYFNFGDGKEELLVAMEHEHKRIFESLLSEADSPEAEENCRGLSQGGLMDGLRELIQPMTTSGIGKDPRDDLEPSEVQNLVDSMLPLIAKESEKTKAFACGKFVFNQLGKLFNDLGAGDSDDEVLANRDARARQKYEIARILRDGRKVFERMHATSLDLDRQFAENAQLVQEAKDAVKALLDSASVTLSEKQMQLSGIRDEIQSHVEAESRVLGENTLIMPNVEDVLDLNPIAEFSPNPDDSIMEYKHEARRIQDKIDIAVVRVEESIEIMTSSESEMRTNLIARFRAKMNETHSELVGEADEKIALVESARISFQNLAVLHEQMLAPYAESKLSSHNDAFAAKIDSLESRKVLDRRAVEAASDDLDLLEATITGTVSSLSAIRARAEDYEFDAKNFASDLDRIKRCKEFIEDHSDYTQKLHPVTASAYRANPENHTEIRRLYSSASAKFREEETRSADGNIACNSTILNRG